MERLEKINSERLAADEPGDEGNSLYSANFEDTPIQAIYYALVNDRRNEYMENSFYTEFHLMNGERDYNE